MRNFHSLNPVKNSTWTIFFWVFLMVVVLSDWKTSSMYLYHFPMYLAPLSDKTCILEWAYKHGCKDMLPFPNRWELGCFKMKSHGYTQVLTETGTEHGGPTHVQARRNHSMERKWTSSPILNQGAICNWYVLGKGQYQQSITRNINNDLGPESVGQHKRDWFL